MTGNIRRLATASLEIAFEDRGLRDAPAVFLLHGWPDDVRAWLTVAPQLNAAGFRTIAPYLRGFGPTRFLSIDTFRDGRAVALAQDAIDLADALDIAHFAVVGHDWGARTAYTLAALFSDRVTAIAALALAYQPRGIFVVPSFAQSRRFWYQWFMALDQGAEAVRKDPKGFARIQWDTWSPPGWFDDKEFAATATSFENLDWADITLHSYRSRWRPEPCDQRYDALQQQLGSVETIHTPTLLIQGSADFCDAPEESEGRERFFTAPYRRILLDGVGHFPMREAPEAVADALLAFLPGTA